MKKRFIAAAVALLIVIASPALAVQQRDGARIRVGCVDIENFLIIDQGGKARGYGAEYLSEIAKHTGWSYEFVRASWTDCLKMLEDGELDLLLPAEYSEARGEKFLFSETECCMDYAALVGTEGDTGLYFEDYKRFNGIAVGLIEDNYLNGIFEDYAQRHNFHVQKRYYETMAELNGALARGEVRAAVNGNMTLLKGQRLLAKMDFMPAYFITSRQRPELMEELNGALHKIKLDNPYYTAGLHSKYYGQIERQAVGFTRAEAEFVQACPPLTVLVDEDNAPLMWYDREAGAYKGIYADLARLIERESGLKFTFLAPEGKSAWTAAAERQGDLLLNAYGSPLVEDVYSLQFTDSYYTRHDSFLGKRGVPVALDAPLRVAVPAGKVDAQAIIRESHPDWKIVTCRDTDASLELVLSGEADITIINAIILQARDYLNLYRNLVVLYADPVLRPVSLGITPGHDPLLEQVLNKAIHKLDEREVRQAVLDNTLSFREPPTLRSLIRDYTGAFFIVLLSGTILVLTALFLLYRIRMQRAQNGLLAQKNQELEEAISVQQQLRVEMEHDPLTRLKNRRAMEYRSNEALTLANGYAALLVIDLDNFKQINDELGHMYGDQVLHSFGSLLNRLAGEKNLAGRVGGDEFAVLLPSVRTVEQAADFAQTLIENVDGLRIGKDKIRITCSVGIGLSSPGEWYDGLFNRADAALYEAKRAGKNNWRAAP